jgi:hypothetical protein
MEMDEASLSQLSYAERERLLSPGARHLMEDTWRTYARRLMPNMPEKEAVAAFKELHAAGLIQLVRDGDGVRLEVL